jgi:cystathionine beta-lyase/cystathionine gamma-synthase
MIIQKPEATDPDTPTFANAGFETICQHFGEQRHKVAGPAAPPIYQTSTFVFPDVEAFNSPRGSAAKPYEYSRVGNPTVAILEGKLAALEKGSWARTFGSGMAAISACVNACVAKDEHIVSVSHVYYPARQHFARLKRYGIETTFVDGANVADFAAAFRDNTRLLYLESPTSGIADCPPVAELVEFAQARGVRVVLDNSWASPYFFQPLELGVDLVLHSATKYIGGHSDVVAGVVIGRDADLRQKIADEAEFAGATLDPFAAWLLCRGVRSLALRMEAHQRSGFAIAHLLAEHPAIAEVHHPGLETHRHHAIARQQLSGYGSLFAFTFKDRDEAVPRTFVDSLRLFSIGVSWGSFESLVIGGPFLRDEAGRPAWITRLFVGLESIDDLRADVSQALKKATGQ